MKYIFVEGYDDSNFICEIIKDKNDIKIIKYAEKKKEKIEGMITTFDKMHDEYIFLADLDGKSEDIRIREIKRRFTNINPENIYFSIQEIESWYLSGISDNHINKYKIKNNILVDTQNITKEKFESLFNKRRETILEIKLNILSEFNFEKAKSRNNSLKLFLENAI